MSDSKNNIFLPESLTLKYFIKISHIINASWEDKLKNSKISEKQIEEMVSAVLEENKRSLLKLNRKCINGIIEFNKKILLETKEYIRIDKLGRALIAKYFENYFPTRTDHHSKIVSEPIEGILPRTICEGIIDAIKCAERIDVTLQYSETCSNISEKYRDPVTNLMNWKKFFQNKKIVDIVESVTERFKGEFSQMGKERRKEWLSNRITETESFSKMKRTLSDEEYDLIESVLLK